MIGIFGAFWGLAGVFLLLGSAVYRLFHVSLEAFAYPFAWYHWVFLLLVVVFMAYSEGYRAFQRGFSPRVAARARYLLEHPDGVYAVLAPVFCMGFFHATRKRKITTISVTAGIIMLVLIVRLIPQPWRGIIDLGVVIGLGWGLLALVAFAFQAFWGRSFSYSAEVPGEESE